MSRRVLITELERAQAEQGMRVLLLEAPRGLGRTHALSAFAAELVARGVATALVPCEALGGEAGAGVDALLRRRLKLASDAPADDVLRAVDAALPGAEALARELFAFALGLEVAGSQTARLDPKARWEGALGEVQRWLARDRTPWALLLDDAPTADAETLGFVELLAGAGTCGPALVVLSARADAHGGAFDARLAALRASGRLAEAALAPPLAVAPGVALAQSRVEGPAAAASSSGVASPSPPLSASGGGTAAAPRAGASTSGRAAERPPAALDRAGGNPLFAAFLERLGDGPAPATLDAAVLEVAARLPEAAARVLDLLCLAGGRLPEGVLETALGEGSDEAVEALLARGLVTAAATRRFAPEREVAVRFPQLVEARAKAAAPTARRSAFSQLLSWGEAVLASGNAWGARAPLVGPLLAAAAEGVGDAARASLAWELFARGAGGVAALRKAEAGAVGTRRLVLARRLAEDEIFRGELKGALATLTAVARTPPAATAVPPGWAAALFEGVQDELERWDLLSHDEAAVGLEVARSEALSQLARSEDTRKAFLALDERLKRLKGPRADALLMRLARTWSWFEAEILADGPAARRVCEAVRRRVDSEVLKAGFHAPAFLRAEQIAMSRGGDTVRARALADELIAVARARNDVRDECIAWNARSLLHLRDGELAGARTGFERSRDLARSVGFRRREAIALHNLGLVLCYLGEHDASLDCQERYLAISEQIGNLVARAYGPAAMAMVHVQRLDARAEPLIAKARKAAEENGWPGLVAWTRLLSGELKLLRYLSSRDSLLLSQARGDLLACLDVLEDKKAGWSEELDPAEVGAVLAVTYRLGGNDARAKAALAAAEKHGAESPLSRAWLDVAAAALAGRRPADRLAALEAQQQRRALELWRQLLPALGA